VTLESAHRRGDIRRREDSQRSLNMLAIFQSVIGGIGLAFSIWLGIIGFNDIALRTIAAVYFFADLAFVISGLCMIWRRWRGLSLIIAFITCPVFPTGSFLAIWTMLVLNRQDVKDIYK
jgi:hypothetical protein